MDSIFVLEVILDDEIQENNSDTFLKISGM